MNPTDELTPSIAASFMDATLLKDIANSSDLKDMLYHSATELIAEPTVVNHNHVLELINILSN